MENLSCPLKGGLQTHIFHWCEIEVTLSYHPMYHALVFFLSWSWLVWFDLDYNTILHSWASVDAVSLTVNEEPNHFPLEHWALWFVVTSIPNQTWYSHSKSLYQEQIKAWAWMEPNKWFPKCVTCPLSVCAVTGVKGNSQKHLLIVCDGEAVRSLSLQLLLHIPALLCQTPPQWEGKA